MLILELLNKNKYISKEYNAIIEDTVKIVRYVANLFLKLTLKMK